MSIWTSIEPASTTVDPGSRATVRLRLRNTGDVVDEYRVVLVGTPALWAVVEPATIKLYPGTTGTVDITFTPPRSPDATAGLNPFGAQVIPTEQSGAVTVVEGNLMITPFTDIRTELLPPTSKGRFRGRPRLAVDNYGNVKVTASVLGNDAGDQLGFDIYPSSLQIEPGRAAFVKATVKPKEITWFGEKETRPFSLTVQRSGAKSKDVDGFYVQRSVLPGWMLTVLGILLAIALMMVVLWFTGAPKVVSLARPAIAPVSASEIPAEVPPVVPPPETEAPVDTGAEQKKEEKKEENGGDGGGGGDTAEKKEEKAEDLGPLPIRADNDPNLLVQFAQLRLVGLNEWGSECALEGTVSPGVLDPATVKSLACFQKVSDERLNGFTVSSDGEGNLGRSTMTALVMYHFTSVAPSSADLGNTSLSVPFLENALVWSSNAEIIDIDLEQITTFTTSHIKALRGEQPLQLTATDQTQMRLNHYQGLVGLPRTGKLDEATFNALTAGRVRIQNAPGTVPAKDWAPAPIL